MERRRKTHRPGFQAQDVELLYQTVPVSQSLSKFSSWSIEYVCLNVEYLKVKLSIEKGKNLQLRSGLKSYSLKFLIFAYSHILVLIPNLISIKTMSDMEFRQLTFPLD